MQYLLVKNEPTVELTGYLDSGALQLRHSTGDLVDNDDAMQAETSGTNIRIKLMDFVDGGAWEINASHEGPTAPINWSRGTDHAYYDFSDYMSNFLEVTTTASNATTNKEKIIDIKTKPEGSLPDNGL